MIKPRKSGRYDVHLTISKESYDEIERIRTKYGLNRSAMIELLISQFDESKLNLDGIELYNAKVRAVG